MIICDGCQQNPATVHLTEIVQKSKKETHLCEGCAKEKGVSAGAAFTVKEFLAGIAPAKSKAAPEKPASEKPAASAASPEKHEKHEKPEKPEKTAEERFPPCPACGITFVEFRQTGRLGCATDYEHFRAGLVPLLEKIHSTTQHTGRVPQRIGLRIQRQREAAQLRQELQEAVAQEDYERAAVLRDKIKALEADGDAP